MQYQFPCSMARLSALSVMGTSVHRVVLIVASFLLGSVLYLGSSSVNLDLPYPDDVGSFFPARRHLQFSTDANTGDNDRMLQLRERLDYTFDFAGYVFNQTGRSHGLKKRVTTSLIHSFSPYVEREAGKRFIDPPHDNIYFANSPAIQWFRGQLVLVSRIWLDREKYEPKDDWPANHFADNWLYTQRFDRFMRPLTNGSILGIPSPKQWWVGDGPIEPRLTQIQDRLFCTFNAAMAFKQQWYMDFTILWDMETNVPIIPKIQGGSPMVRAAGKDEMPRDKHWMSLVDHDQLYFVHNLDPLRVMHCTLEGECNFVHDDSKRDGLNFNDHISHLRGGTPFELYEYPYYVGIAHCTMYKSSNHKRFYTAHLVVIRANPFRIVYVSNDIRIHPQIYETTPMVRARYIEDGFIFPVGLLVENRDTIAIGVHVNDHSSVVIRMRGLENLLGKVIETDKADNPEQGPPVGYLQKHIHDISEKVLRVNFVH